MLFLIPAGILACVFADKVTAECEKKLAVVDRKVAEAQGRGMLEDCLEASAEEWEKHCSGNHAVVQIPDHCGGEVGVFTSTEIWLLGECQWDIRQAAVVVAVAEGRRRVALHEQSFMLLCGEHHRDLMHELGEHAA